MEPLELLDQIEAQIGLRTTPATWPVGSFGDLRGVIDRRTDVFTRFTRTARGSQIAPEEDVPAERAASEEGAAWTKSTEETELLSAMEADVDLPSFLAGESTPVFAGSSRRPRRRAWTSTTSPATWTSRAPRSCSRCRPTWTATTVTASRSPASVPAGSIAAW
jgi:hypothetical protein